MPNAFLSINTIDMPMKSMYFFGVDGVNSSTLYTNGSPITDPFSVFTTTIRSAPNRWLGTSPSTMMILLSSTIKDDGILSYFF